MGGPHPTVLQLRRKPGLLGRKVGCVPGKQALVSKSGCLKVECTEGRDGLRFLQGQPLHASSFFLSFQISQLLRRQELPLTQWLKARTIIALVQCGSQACDLSVAPGAAASHLEAC